MTNIHGIGDITVTSVSSDKVTITIRDVISGGSAQIDLTHWEAMMFSEQIKETVLNGYPETTGDSEGLQHGDDSTE